MSRRRRQRQRRMAYINFAIIALLIAGVIYVTLFIVTATTVGQFDVVRDFYQRYGAFALLAVSVALWSSVTGVRYFFLQKKSRPDS